MSFSEEVWKTFWAHRNYFPTLKGTVHNALPLTNMYAKTNVVT